MPAPGEIVKVTFCNGTPAGMRNTCSVLGLTVTGAEALSTTLPPASASELFPA